MAVVRHKEAIHSGHFMISSFEAEDQDDEENIAVPVPMEESNANIISPDISTEEEIVNNHFQPLVSFLNSSNIYSHNLIDVSLTKLFQCMSIAYRQKLTSPKWNRFRGMKLRWKDKIRLNNVIWRCWHMQFIKGHRRLVCNFANPLDIDNHNKTEAGAILEGKYWKRKLTTVTAEYKRWRIFYKKEHEMHPNMPPYSIDNFMDVTNTMYQYGTKDDVDLETMINDADFFVDALFNSIGSHRDYPRVRDPGMTNNADVIQPEMAHFHNNLDELLDLDPIAPLQDWLSNRLTEVETIAPFIRGKSLTPEQDIFSIPLPDIKDIDVITDGYPQYTQIDSRYRPISSSGPPSVLVMRPNCSKPSKVENSGDKSSSAASQAQQISTTSTAKQEEAVKTSHPNYEHKRHNVNGFKGGKLWSAAVKQAQEMEAQSRLEYRAQSGEMLATGSVSEVPYLPTSVPSSSLHYVTRTLEQREARPYPRVCVQPTPHSASTGQHSTAGSMPATRPSPPLGPGRPYQRAVQQIYTHAGGRENSEESVLDSSPVEMEDLTEQTVLHQAVIRGNLNNKVEINQLGYRTYEFIKRSDPLDYHDEMKSKIPRLDVFSNNTFSLQGLGAMKTDETKSRRVSAPAGFPPHRPIMFGNSGGPMQRLYSQRTIKRERSELVQLLQENKPRPRIKHELEDAGIHRQRRRGGKSIPPPPPGSLPQPSFNIGSSLPNPGIADDMKLSMAEQKRRCTIKNGFDFLKALVPSLAENPNLKISKAALLLKGAEYVEQLKSEREALATEIRDMKSSVERLTAEITHFQSQLPSQGSAPTSLQHRQSELGLLFEHHVAACTMQNWKYWVFSKLMHPLLDSYDKTVSSSSFEDMVRTSSSWLDQHASLVQLRPLILNALKDLSIKTDILTEPHKMPQEALNAISTIHMQTSGDRSRRLSCGSDQEGSEYI